MARDRSQDPDDIDALLAEVDRTLQGGSAAGRPPAKREERAAKSRAGVGSRLSKATSTAVVSGVAAAVIVGVLFALLPFLAVWSGSIGAFCAAFGVGFVLGLRNS
jgi:hypothetical protein